MGEALTSGSVLTLGNSSGSGTLHGVVMILLQSDDGDEEDEDGETGGVGVECRVSEVTPASKSVSNCSCCGRMSEVGGKFWIV